MNIKKMITSIPELTKELGMSFQDYEDIAKNIARISLIPRKSRQRILERGDLELSAELRTKALSLMEEMAYSREVYKISGLDSSQGPPQNEKLFITAITDYLLRNKERFDKYKK